MSSYRLWWLIAFCALAIGVAIERDAPPVPKPESAAPARAALNAPDSAPQAARNGG